jgi:hypothetical protein
LALALAIALPARRTEAQRDSAGADAAGTVWRLAGLRKGFCVHLLLDPAKLRIPVPGKVRLLRADAVAELHPALRQVVANQPEYAAWSPSALCLFYLSRVEAGRVRAGNEDPAKAPVLGVWTVTAASEGSPAERQVALDLRSNDGDLREAGRAANLELERLYSSIGPVPREEGPPRPGEVRYLVRLGKAVLTWD